METIFILKPSSATQGDGIRLLNGSELLECGLGRHLLEREKVCLQSESAAAFQAQRSSLIDALNGSSSSSSSTSSHIVKERNDAESWVVQRYLETPLLTPLPVVLRDDRSSSACRLSFHSHGTTDLVSLHKFDLRLYVLVVAGADIVSGATTPRGDFKAYLYNDGLVRICAEPYEELNFKEEQHERGATVDGSDSSVAAAPMMCAHLTNSHLNAQSPNWDAKR